MEITVKTNTIDEAIALITEIAGRKRERILNSNDLLQVLQEAQVGIWGVRAGDTVANKYGYPAYRMRLAAVKKTDGHYAIWCDWGSASKGSSPIPGDLPRQYNLSNNDFGLVLRRYADNLTDNTPTPDALLSASEVNKALRQRRNEAREKARAGIHWSYPDWNGRIIRMDSINAGNCVTQTDSVIHRMGVSRYTTANSLRNWIINNAPTLVNYADRAIIKAYERQVIAQN